MTEDVGYELQKSAVPTQEVILQERMIQTKLFSDRLRFRWASPASGIRCGPHDHREILQAPAPPHRTITVISIGAKYAKIDRGGIQRTLSISQLAAAAKERNSTVDDTADLRPDTDTIPLKETSMKEEKNFYALEDVVGHTNRPTKPYYTVPCYGYGP